MIGLGSQYLTAAGFGRYRITAASLGNLDLFGKFWLTAATLQAILGAFGDDGWAVIKATNAYLDGIAASDRDKATALAGFINEDPMMVCSLGLEVPGVTMPIRTLNGDGTAYIDTGIVGTAYVNFNLRIDVWGITYNTDSIGYNLDGIGGSMGTSSYVGIKDSKLTYGSYYGSSNRDNVSNINAAYEVYHHLWVDYKNKTTGCDSNSLTFQMTQPPAMTATYLLFGWNATPAPHPHRANKSRATYAMDGEYLRDYIPFKTGKAWAAEDVSTGVAQVAGTCGMIDLVSGKFFPNANSQGSFTIPDISYTPSTP